MHIDTNPNIDRPNNDAHNLVNGYGYSEIIAPESYAWSNEDPSNISEAVPYHPDNEHLDSDYNRQQTQETIAGYVPLRQEVDQQIAHAISHVQAENAQTSLIEAGIEAREAEISKIDAELLKNISKNKRGILTQKRIDLVSGVETAKDIIKKLPKQIEDSHDPNGSFRAMYDQASFKAAKGRVREVEEKVERRRKILERLNNPSTDGVTRLMDQQLVDSWGNNFTLDGYRDELLRELSQQHEQTVAKEWQEKEIKTFESTEEELIKRIEVIEELNSTTNAARRDELHLEITSWKHKSDIGAFRASLLGNNPVSIQRFQAWVASTARAKFNKIQQNPEEYDSSLKAKIKLENELRALKEATAELQAKADQTDEVESTIKKNLEEISAMETEKSDWETTVQELRDKVIADANKTYQLHMKAAA